MERSHFTQRNLPHISRASKPLFVTFNTRGRVRLPPGARTLALRHALAGHGSAFWMHVAVVMPDHVHLILTTYDGEYGLPRIMKGVKGAASRRINQLLGRAGNLWAEESFDHIVRNYEWTRQKIEYVCNNPVRAGLVDDPNHYPWLWRAWVEGGGRGVLPTP